jgi:hypothetical protein
MVVDGGRKRRVVVLVGAVSEGAVVAMQAGCGEGRSPRGAPAPSEARVRVASAKLAAVRVDPPAAPAPYRVPASATRITSSHALAEALVDGRRESLVLARGTYDSARPFVDRDGDRIYASRLGAAVLKAGLVVGANEGRSGALVRGIRFDVSDPRKTLDGAIVHVWGSATHAQVLDSSFDGHGVVDAGLVVRQPEGFVARRLTLTSFRSYGVLVDPNRDGYRASAPYVLSDLAISNVQRRVPGSSDGTAEACLWLGSKGTARRLSVRRCGVSGIWTGSAITGSRIGDVAIDRTRVGIYIEHFTTGTTFRRLRVGPDVSRGVNAEWANGAVGGRPASVDNVIEDGYFETKVVGVYLDEGTTRTTIRRCKFVGQSWAAIGDYKGVDNRYADNDYRAIAARAVAISFDHGGGR